MRTVTLNREVLLRTIGRYLGQPGFPGEIYIALETYSGFGECAGGVGVGCVVNALHDLEGGGFIEMASIESLVPNLGRADPGAGTDFEFASEVNGFTIKWE